MNLTIINSTGNFLAEKLINVIHCFAKTFAQLL